MYQYMYVHVHVTWWSPWVNGPCHIWNMWLDLRPVLGYPSLCLLLYGKRTIGNMFQCILVNTPVNTSKHW